MAGWKSDGNKTKRCTEIRRYWVKTYPDPKKRLTNLSRNAVISSQPSACVMFWLQPGFHFKEEETSTIFVNPVTWPKQGGAHAILDSRCDWTGMESGLTNGRVVNTLTRLSGLGLYNYTVVFRIVTKENMNRAKILLYRVRIWFYIYVFVLWIYFKYINLNTLTLLPQRHK